MPLPFQFQCFTLLNAVESCCTLRARPHKARGRRTFAARREMCPLGAIWAPFQWPPAAPFRSLVWENQFTAKRASVAIFAAAFWRPGWFGARVSPLCLGGPTSGRALHDDKCPAARWSRAVAQASALNKSGRALSGLARALASPERKKLRRSRRRLGRQYDYVAATFLSACCESSFTLTG